MCKQKFLYFVEYCYIPFSYKTSKTAIFPDEVSASHFLDVMNKSGYICLLYKVYTSYYVLDTVQSLISKDFKLNIERISSIFSIKYEVLLGL